MSADAASKPLMSNTVLGGSVLLILLTVDVTPRPRKDDDAAWPATSGLPWAPVLCISNAWPPGKNSMMHRGASKGVKGVHSLSSSSALMP
eukprot:CAMPEP_0195023416 /NCGR_PEP_ID=MMETSP0326_2-20130528/42818_1 /TAXON_ID=2866 ORGANISM="Crypthecodinium cohnii, Strain Seligo" /NCGR_SAMPLE_ID=MMETSP0326_2 /ASSEMBLY_ACC=CAM_ASM_000348 /LENGTH=89 /DNA_ID=CAMNT_0040043689 /DNA_START=8 /DNA_END=275 /DNA_ORIENTATION=+